MERALIISNLTKSYGREPVLTRLALEVPAGTIFGLIGPNGAGKSTLIGILTGILNYNEGQIILNGLELNRANEIKIKKDISSVLQPPLLFENFTSYEFVNYICKMYQETPDDLDEKINSLFKYFEIEDYRHVQTKQLSSGSRKKLAFCTAILVNPKILFLDEPFESVDVISIGRMKNVIRKLKERGTTIFITSHILEVVENLCDDIAILNKGEIVAYLDSKARRELQKDSSLSEIFERYVDMSTASSALIDWI